MTLPLNHTEDYIALLVAQMRASRETIASPYLMLAKRDHSSVIAERAQRLAMIERAARDLSPVNSDMTYMDRKQHGYHAPVDPRDPDPTRSGIFRDHNCSYCQSGALPCRQGAPSQCEYPHARND